MGADGTARVVAGALRAQVPITELFAADPPAPGRAPTRGSNGDKRALAPFEGAAVALQTQDNTCDLRGLRVDDAVAMAIAYLDRALNDGLRVCFLVHGHGTGAVRDALRKELATSPYVGRFRAGGQHEGGDGATIVELA